MVLSFTLVPALHRTRNRKINGTRSCIVFEIYYLRLRVLIYRLLSFRLFRSRYHIPLGQYVLQLPKPAAYVASLCRIIFCRNTDGRRFIYFSSGSSSHEKPEDKWYTQEELADKNFTKIAAQVDSCGRGVTANTGLEDWRWNSDTANRAAPVFRQRKLNRAASCPLCIVFEIYYLRLRYLC